MRKVKVALVNMPFATLYRPSIGLSLLKAALERDGHAADLYYLNLDFAERIGSRLYTQIAASAPTALMGEWVFSEALFGPDALKQAAYIEDILRPCLDRSPASPAMTDVLRARELAAPYLDACLAGVDWARYDIIGFTSVFQQNVATLAVARKLKERYPEKLLAIGGANAEGPMGLAILRAFPYVDLVCSGEGDLAFPEFVRRFAADEPLSGIPGIALQGDLPLAGAGQPGSYPVMDMDALPYPNYDDYFGQLSRHAYRDTPDEEVRFMFESSRGCWWGAKSHCKFCGLNGSTMAFRSKSAARALAELTYLYDRYGRFTTMASAVDNIIDMAYFKSFLPALRDLGLDLDMFYETKANLTREQVQTMADAGFTRVQPGIESLSTSVLRLMRKGISALQNIQVLKWCAEFQVKPLWNYLTGFPGEEPDEYEQAARLVPLLSHLEPPVGSGKLRLDRFSPYFNEAAAHGIVGVAPIAAYGLVYTGLPADLLTDLAYYFQFDYADGRDVSAYTAELEAVLDAWRNSRGSELFSVPLGARTLVVDLRPVARQAIHELTGPPHLLYRHCDAIRSRTSLGRYLEEQGHPLSERDLEAMLSSLLADGLMVSEGDQFLSLAVPLGRYSPGPEGAARFLELLAHLRSQTGQENGDQTVLPVSAPVR